MATKERSMSATQELRIEVGNLKGKMNLKGKGHTPFTVSIDYPPPLGEDQGFTSLELLMVSLASCSCHTIQYLIERSGAHVTKIGASAIGHRRADEHPTVLTKIELNYALSGERLCSEVVESAIRTAEDKMCPVWAMLKDKVEIHWKYAVE
jgi:uncharacterized OsmC-like protein